MSSLANGGVLQLLLPILIPALGGLCIAVIRPLDTPRGRRAAVTAALALTLASALWTQFRQDGSLTLLQLLPNLPLLLKADATGRFFAGLISLVFLCIGIYSFDYMAHEGREKRYYSFFFFSLAALNGVSFSGSLLTLFLFHEAAALLALPLITHSRKKEALAAGDRFLFFTALGALLVLTGFFLMNLHVSVPVFIDGGALDLKAVAGNEPALRIALFLMILGFSAQAGMLPLHAWLPAAHPYAPGPSSAVVSGVLTKAGVLGVLRVIYCHGSPALLAGTWVQNTCLILALATVLMGSTMALLQDVLKKRLAYSTVSQVSYVLYGLFTLTSSGVTGALLHVFFHAVVKSTLAMAAGAIILKTGKTRISELSGIGRQMPVTMICFTLASLGLVGLPATGGYLSKHYLMEGGLSTAHSWNWAGPAVLWISAGLTAVYLFSVAVRGFFPGKNVPRASLPKAEPTPRMWAPLVFLAVLCLLGGLFHTPLSNFLYSLAETLT